MRLERICARPMRAEKPSVEGACGLGIDGQALQGAAVQTLDSPSCTAPSPRFTRKTGLENAVLGNLVCTCRLLGLVGVQSLDSWGGPRCDTLTSRALAAGSSCILGMH